MINLLLAGLLLFGIGCSKDEPEKEEDSAINGNWVVKAISISGELTNIGAPPDNASYSNISITIPDTTLGSINGNTFMNQIWVSFEIKEHKHISFKDYGGSRCAEDSWGIAFADHIRSTIKKFDVSNSELHLIDSLDNTVILFIDGLNKN
ncbi:MAG TPA: hypothetical protein PK941_13330 [Paludibacter sp.]|nr:hypothetical protein [Paludibacter sp.]